MKEEFIRQYSHAWDMFEGIVRDFDDEAWYESRRGVIAPSRIAFHILQSVRYYIEDRSTVELPSGKSFETDWRAAEPEDLPTRKDIVSCIYDFSEKTERWITGKDLAGMNRTFSHAGKTGLGVILYLLKHNLYHIGELNTLLNESRDGKVEDNWTKALG